MNVRKLLQKVSISVDGSILLGEHVVCDSFQKGRHLAVFTHIHADHMIGFNSALGAFGTDVLVSVPTRDLLVAIEGKHLLRRTNCKARNWGVRHSHSEENVTLYPTDHILGSSQVLVEDQEGYRLVYTGDFNLNTQPIEADILVVDATYGPLRRNYAMSDVMEEMIYLIQRQLRRGEPVYIFSRTGRIQRLMAALRKEGVDVPFISTFKEFKIAQVYEKYRYKIGDYFPNCNMEAWEIMRKEDPYVAFYPIGQRVPLADKYLNIKATAYGALFPIYMTEKNRYVAALSDHSDFEGTLNYIKRSNPRLVITDGFRAGENARLLAKALNKEELNIKVRALP